MTKQHLHFQSMYLFQATKHLHNSWTEKSAVENLSALGVQCFRECSLKQQLNKKHISVLHLFFTV